MPAAQGVLLSIRVLLTRRDSAAMATALWAGRATAEEVFRVQDDLFHWALQHGASRVTAQQVVNCLQEDFLLRLPIPEASHDWPEHPGTKNWRYLCRRQIGRLLRCAAL